jgi:hypothetical protein
MNNDAKAGCLMPVPFITGHTGRQTIITGFMAQGET